jgi:ammonia channel protein AmtB
LNLDLGSTIWLSIGAILVFLMIPAISMLEARLIRRKNVVNGLMKGSPYIQYTMEESWSTASTQLQAMPVFLSISMVSS